MKGNKAQRAAAREVGRCGDEGGRGGHFFAFFCLIKSEMKGMVKKRGCNKKMLKAGQDRGAMGGCSDLLGEGCKVFHRITPEMIIISNLTPHTQHLTGQTSSRHISTKACSLGGSEFFELCFHYGVELLVPAGHEAAEGVVDAYENCSVFAEQLGGSALLFHETELLLSDSVSALRQARKSRGRRKKGGRGGEG